MYDRKSKNKTAYSVLFLILPVMFMCSCKSTSVYDNGRGNTEYRELQSEIRNGETELALTGKDIEYTSRNIEQTGKQLEQSIRNSETNEQELGKILQQIRERKITSD